MNDRKPQTQGSRLKELINSRGYTQEEFAKLIAALRNNIITCPIDEPEERAVKETDIYEEVEA